MSHGREENDRLRLNFPEKHAEPQVISRILDIEGNTGVAQKLNSLIENRQIKISLSIATGFAMEGEQVINLKPVNNSDLRPLALEFQSQMMPDKTGPPDEDNFFPTQLRQNFH
jgi:hypothetical protein